MYDNYDAFREHDAQQEASEKRWLARLPECSGCGEKIRGEHCWKIGDEYYCEECIDSFRDYTENHMEG